jgi:hypothetical protein
MIARRSDLRRELVVGDAAVISGLPLRVWPDLPRRDECANMIHYHAAEDGRERITAGLMDYDGIVM